MGRYLNNGTGLQQLIKLIKTNDAAAQKAASDISDLIGVANGIAKLDENGLVPSSELPSYVDDVLEYDTKSNFPETGEAGKIYVAKDTNLTYRWSGSTYVEISASLALGETSSTAYAGDKGKANADAIAAETTRAKAAEEANAAAIANVATTAEVQALFDTTSSSD